MRQQQFMMNETAISLAAPGRKGGAVSPMKGVQAQGKDSSTMENKIFDEIEKEVEYRFQ